MSIVYHLQYRLNHTTLVTNTLSILWPFIQRLPDKITIGAPEVNRHVRCHSETHKKLYVINSHCLEISSTCDYKRAEEQNCLLAGMKIYAFGVNSQAAACCCSPYGCSLCAEETGWVPNPVLLRVPTKLHRYYQVLIQVKSICAKFRYLTVHLGERVKYTLEEEREWDHVTSPLQRVQPQHTGRAMASQKRSQVWLHFSKLDADNTL